jgi:predicted GIY-YIG superfamily endonuclease
MQTSWLSWWGLTMEWFKAKDDIMGEQSWADCCAMQSNWVDGIQYKYVGGDLYINREACRLANVSMMRELSDRLDRSTTALYRYYSEDGELLYVGISINPILRLQQHQQASWCEQVSHIDIERFESRAEALQAEAEAIRNESPAYNIAHNAAEH